MIQSPGLLLTIVAFLCVIGPLVFVHEMGHYWAARLFGVKIDAFSIGMGREITGWSDRRGTRWKLGWAPIGGYVRFAGDMNAVSQPSAEWLALPAGERARTFQAKPVWQRAIIVAAGPAVNFVFAVLILAGFAMAFGDATGPARIGEVVPGSAASAAGLRPGDRVLALDGQAVARFADMSARIRPRAGQPVRITFERAGARREVTIVPRVQEVALTDGRRVRLALLGVGPAGASLPEAVVSGVRQTGRIVQMMADLIVQLFAGERSVKELGGPLQIAKVSGEQMAIGWSNFAYLAALLSINLGFINLLPVPMLDGGHLLFYAIEAVRRRPVARDVQEWAYRGGLAALLALMLLVTVNDLGSFGLWSRLAGLIG